VDLPVLSAEVQRVFVERFDKVVFDVGGDTVGATALGQYHAKFGAVRGDAEVLAVINTRRPLCATPEAISELLRQMSFVSRLKIDGIVNNANLARDSEAALLSESEAILREVTKTTGIPVQYLAGLPEVLKKYTEISGKIGKIPEQIPISVYTRPEWLDITVE